MLAYVNPPLRRNYFAGLWLLWAALLFGGFLFGPADPYGRMPLWTRITSSIILVITGWSWYALYRAHPRSRALLLLAVGMTCGLLGDLILAGLLPGGRSVLGGITAFGVGHIFYIMAALRLGKPRPLALSIWLLLGLVGWYLMVFHGQDAGVLHWAALPYALLLASTAGFATCLLAQDRLYLLFAIGAALFFLSDLILAGSLFSGLQFRLIDDVIWLTYGPGQMLIVWTASVILREK